MLLWTLGCMDIFKWEFSFFSEYVSRSRIVGSYGRSIFTFLRNFHIVFHSGYANLQLHQLCRWVFFHPQLLQHFLFIVFLMITFLFLKFFIFLNFLLLYNTVLVLPYVNMNPPSNRCEMIPHCGFDMYFFNNKWCWASSHVPVG